MAFGPNLEPALNVDVESKGTPRTSMVFFLSFLKFDTDRFDVRKRSL